MFKKKSPLKSSKLVQRKRRIFWVKVSGVVFCIALLLGLIIWLAHLKNFILTTITIDGNSAVEANVLHDIAQADISGNYLFVFPRSNKFLYPKSAIAADIMNESTRIKSVDVSTSGHTIAIHVEERTPQYTWCSGAPLDTQPKKCYFLDSNGYIFSQAPIFSGNAFFAFYGLFPDQTPVGLTYLDSMTFRKLDQVLEFLESKKINAFAFEAEPTGVYNLYLEKGGKIIFKDDEDSTALISTIGLVIDKTSIFKANGTSTLEYVDLRFGNKLFYKYKGDSIIHE